MPEYVPDTASTPSIATVLQQAGLRRDLARIERQTLTRMAGVQGSAMVQSTKVQELGNLGRHSLADIAMLHHTANVVAGSDVLLRDKLALVEDIVRVGIAETIADTVTDFCRR